MNALLLAVAFGALLAGAATLAERNHFGLLHQVAWLSWAELLLGFVVFDLWMYLWHRANHRIPLLWRFHRMHHSDPEMNVTTCGRRSDPQRSGASWRNSGRHLETLLFAYNPQIPAPFIRAGCRT